MPKARIVIGHGQMPKDELEKVMRTFVQGKADILLATTIIESGIDIPNANTIIIDRADRFGLADLYQLRGRVGRAGHRAYAYLMLPRSAATTGDARKRLRHQAVHGAGFRLQDSHEGPGNTRRGQPAGHPAERPYCRHRLDLYCQLLQQSIAYMQGRYTAPRPDAALRTDFIVNSETQFAAKSRKDCLGAFLPRDYISDAALRISAYKDLAAVRTLKEADALSGRVGRPFRPCTGNGASPAGFPQNQDTGLQSKHLHGGNQRTAPDAHQERGFYPAVQQISAAGRWRLSRRQATGSAGNAEEHLNRATAFPAGPSSGNRKAPAPGPSAPNGFR